MAGQAIEIRHIHIEDGRMCIEVVLDSSIPHRTDSLLANRINTYCPSLHYHTCINDRGPTFAAAIEDTPLPHVLEHLIIHFQTVDAQTAPDHRFVGTTRWIDERRGIAHIEVNFYDDLVALQAVKHAQIALQEILFSEHTTSWSTRHNRTDESGEEGR